MYEIVGSGLEDFWIVESIIQVISVQCQIIRLICDEQGEYINGSNLMSSAIFGKTRQLAHSAVYQVSNPRCKMTNLTVFILFRELYGPVTTAVSTVQNFSRVHQTYSGGDEIIVKQSAHDVVLCCQPIFLPVVVGYWRVIDSLIYGNLLEDPAVYVHPLKFVAHFLIGYT